MAFQEGDIVQIIDEKHHWFPALLIVTEDKGWGIMGYHVVCNNDPEKPNGLAFIRIKNEQIELVGKAAIIRQPAYSD
jgi:hypothetical protein